MILRCGVSHLAIAIIAVICTSTSTDAFGVPKPTSILSSSSLSRMDAVSMDGDDKTNIAERVSKLSVAREEASSSSTQQDDLEWAKILDSKALQEVREELILKYLEQGTSQDVAEREVEEFLSDRERSEKYLEMRAYASAQADDLGIGLGLQLIGGFLVGFLAIAAPKFMDAAQ